MLKLIIFSLLIQGPFHDPQTHPSIFTPKKGAIFTSTGSVLRSIQNYPKLKNFLLILHTMSQCHFKILSFIKNGAVVARPRAYHL